MCNLIYLILYVKPLDAHIITLSSFNASVLQFCIFDVDFLLFNEILHQIKGTKGLQQTHINVCMLASKVIP